MTTQFQTYGHLIRLDAGGDSAPEVLERVPPGAGVSSGSIDEATLQNLLFRYPEALPIAAIDPAYSGAVPICTELTLPAGYADALYVNALGRLTLAEFKLWRNPQARREVIGQILDYAKDLASCTYEDLQRQVSLALGKTGNALYDLVQERHPEVNEAEFVDNVTRHLRRGEFLLLIVGDGIREEAASIVDFVQRYSGLHFNLAMVEAALYRDDANRLIVQPRVLARTEIVQRIVVDRDLGSMVPADVIAEAEAEEPLAAPQEQNLQFWTAALQGYSFADQTVAIPGDLWPIPPKNPTLTVKVRNTGFAGWGLSFSGYLGRSYGEIGCYLTPMKGWEREARIFDELVESLAELRQGLPGLEQWDSSDGRPRIGFRRQGSLAFLSASEESEDFRAAVAWMREHWNRLVSELNPRLQAKLKDER